MFNISRFLVVILPLVLVLMSNTDGKFVCTWFLFDDNSATNPGATGNADGIATQTEAQSPQNYRFIPKHQVPVLCSGTVKLCAICSDNFTGSGSTQKPVLSSGQAIRTAIDSYYFSNNTAIVDNPTRIIEHN